MYKRQGYTIIIGGSLTDPKLDENFMLNGNLLATSGTQLANVAKRKASLSISKGFTIFNGQEGSWDLNVSRTGKRKSSITNPVNQGAYTIAGLSSTLQGESWDAVLYVDNLLDERAVIWEYQGFRPETKFTNRPREFGLRLKYKF